MKNAGNDSWFRYEGKSTIVCDILWTSDILRRYTWTPSEGWAEHMVSGEGHITIEGSMPITDDF